MSFKSTLMALALALLAPLLMAPDDLICGACTADAGTEDAALGDASGEDAAPSEDSDALAASEDDGSDGESAGDDDGCQSVGAVDFALPALAFLCLGAAYRRDPPVGE